METSKKVRPSKADFLNAVQRFPQSRTNDEMHALEKILNSFTKDPQSIQEILSSMKTNPGVALMLSVLLTKSVNNVFCSLPKEGQDEVFGLLAAGLLDHRDQTQVLLKISEALASAFALSEKKIDEVAAVMAILAKGLQMDDRKDFLVSLVVLQSVADLSPDSFKPEYIDHLSLVVDKVFSSPYDKENSKIYIACLGCLASFTRNFKVGDSQKISDNLNKLLSILEKVSVTESDFMREQLEEMEVIITNTFENASEKLDEGADLGAAGKSLALFAVKIAFKPEYRQLSMSPRATAVEFLSNLVDCAPSLVNPKKNSLLKDSLPDIVAALVFEQEANAQKLIRKEITEVELFKEEDFALIVFSLFEKLCRKFKSKETKKLVADLRVALKDHICLHLRLISDTSEALQNVYSKEVESILKELILPALKSQKVAPTVLALRLTCFLCEHLGSDILDLYEQFLPTLMEFVLRHEGLDETQRLVVVSALFALELVVENLDEEDLAPYSDKIIRSVSMLCISESLDAVTRKAAIVTLSSSFASASSALLSSLMGSLLQVLTPCLKSEFLAPSALVALGRLCFNGLKDDPAKDAKFVEHFKPVFDKSLEIIHIPDAEFELLEGALSVGYFTIKLLEKRAVFVTQALFDHVCSLVRNSSPQGVPVDRSDSEEEFEEQEVHQLAQLPHAYMISAALHFAAESLLHFPHLGNAATEAMLALSAVAASDAERGQAANAVQNWVLGAWRELKQSKVNLLLAMIGNWSPAVETKDIAEQLDVIGYLGEELAKIGGAVILDDAAFLGPLASALTPLLEAQLRRGPDETFFVAVCEALTGLSRGCRSEVFQSTLLGFFRLFVCVLNPEVEADDALVEEFFGFIGEVLTFNPAFLGVLLAHEPANFASALRAASSFDCDGIRRNCAFLLGAIFEQMVFPVLSSPAELGSLCSILKDLFSKSQELVAKENCVSALVKLYLNTPYAAAAGDLVVPQKVFEAADQILPLQADFSETPAFVRGIVRLAENGYVEAMKNSKNIVLFLCKVIGEGKGKHELADGDWQLARKLLQALATAPQVAVVVESIAPADREKIAKNLQD